MKTVQFSELPLPVSGATAGLPSSVNHQQDLPPDSFIGYNPEMSLSKQTRPTLRASEKLENGIGSQAEIMNEARYRVRTAGQASSGTRRKNHVRWHFGRVGRISTQHLRQTILGIVVAARLTTWFPATSCMVECTESLCQFRRPCKLRDTNQ